MPSTHDSANRYAAIDLGSNSFHMLIAERDGEQLRPLDSLRESVRLGAGLDADDRLTAEARQRALDCLARFAQRLRGVPLRQIRAVGTNTLRRARDAADFTREASELLGVAIEIIAGREEARLIYLGVAHTNPGHEGARLVVDIGGGSTELIIGRGETPALMESLKAGCVFATGAHFADGVISRARMRAAVTATELEIQPLARDYRAAGWSEALGASGTIKATGLLLAELGLGHGDDISRDGLRALRLKLVEIGHVDRLDFSSVSRERQRVIAGGVAALCAVFRALDIERMQVSQGALREGVLYDLVGVRGHRDVRECSVEALAARFSCEPRQAARVAASAGQLLKMVAADWSLGEADAELLHYACQLHELGLAVSHAHHQRHGAYLLENMDLFGFSQNEQRALAVLVGAQRRKPRADSLTIPGYDEEMLARLATVLRLAVLLHRDHSDHPLPPLRLAAAGEQLNMTLPGDWLDEHPLTGAELQREQRHLRLLEIELRISD